jgi:hypothetical protein
MKAMVMEMPCIIKASSRDGRRIIELEASNESMDLEGDVILQSALLKSKESFLRYGALDIDHISEIGDRLSPPIYNMTDYVVGRPLEVNDLGNGRTGVVGEISKSSDSAAKCEELWRSLTMNPPVQWRASIYGYPVMDEVRDCTQTACSHGATRYLVSGIDWKSLALTRNPMNDKITGYARVVSAKSFIGSTQKASDWWPDSADIFASGDEPLLSSMVGGLPGDVGGSAIAEDASMGANGGIVHAAMNCPKDMTEVWDEYMGHILQDCPCYQFDVGNTLSFFREHYIICRGLPFDKADILAHALLGKILREVERRR